jgi:diadenosine tetraphosphate (Ap4A) HIT family hydrolase
MKRLLFRSARSPISRYFIGWVFTYMSWSIPVNRLHETPTLLAFYHPVPLHPVHILIVPKRMYANITAINSDDAPFFGDLFQTVAKLVADLSLEAPGYRLICNGGAYQDVPQVHFHLISG